ncbi:MAG TPA: hypothetical protein VIM21_15390 [Gemmatimonadaceae bacterium]
MSKYSDERWVAACPIADVPLLLRYDHHTVSIDGRGALLLTYLWMERAPENRGEMLDCVVSFTYAAGHPPAPPEVQAIVNRLSFHAHR